MLSAYNPSQVSVGDLNVTTDPATASTAKFATIVSTESNITIPAGADKVAIRNVDLVDTITVNARTLDAELGFHFESVNNSIENKVERSPEFVIQNPGSNKVHIVVTYPGSSGVDLSLII